MTRDASHSPSSERPLRARQGMRGHLGLLLVCCAALLASGMPPSDARLVGRSDALAPIPLDLVGGALRRSNPALSDPELLRIASAVTRSSRRHGLDPELVTAVLIVESGARPWVRSPKGAVGLMQVMPHMMQPLGLAGSAASIESNVEAGCAILAHNIARLGEERGISAYFWGSRIRGVAYLERVRAARAALRSAHAS